MWYITGTFQLILQIASPVQMPSITTPEHPHWPRRTITSIQYFCADGERSLTMQGGHNTETRLIGMTRNGVDADQVVLDKLNRILAERFDGVRQLVPECHSAADPIHIVGSKGGQARERYVSWSTTSIWPEPDDPGLD